VKARRLQLESYRGFETLDLQLDEELTVLVGTNGSGKTSVLEALAAGIRLTLAGHGDWMLGMDRDMRNGASTSHIVVELAHDGVDSSKPSSTQLDIVLDGVNFRPAIVVDPTQQQSGPVPIGAYYPVSRTAVDRTPGSTTPRQYAPTDAWLHAFEPSISFEQLFAWFREREDLENETLRYEPAYKDHALAAARAAVEQMLPGVTNPRVRRPRGDGTDRPSFREPVLTVTKADELLSFRQLSEGERTLTALAADIARRLAIANPGAPPLEGKGIVLIDEIELHLHPTWQVRVLASLRRTFPNVQLVVTTHSPLVLSRVADRHIRLLKDFQVFASPTPTRGRDPSALLDVLFEVSPREETTAKAVRHVARLLDDERLDEARVELEKLERSLGGEDAEVVRLRTIMELLAS
jgi:predicted ATP-binding protein involved in virulence